VRFLRPDLAGHSGVVSGVQPDGRVLVEVTVFGRATTFELEPEDLSSSS
jgi:transcription antitermination factor NusG